MRASDLTAGAGAITQSSATQPIIRGPGRRARVRMVLRSALSRGTARQSVELNHWADSAATKSPLGEYRFVAERIACLLEVPAEQLTRAWNGSRAVGVRY